ncbi:prefoldin subunit beta [Candidatus Pacearchaeota archaeon]|jgi:prefoldin beta subunit|nr:prefoldin subunit beta [Candidatus Pacearchaeota archaeon]|tara:strand:- start:1 stop:321 length:321 start_codon:yes stop_codon:yes gene_type:complete
MVEDDKIQEMQIIEQNLQNLFLQKQAFQMELSETQTALKEIEKSGDEVFKIIGQLMVKTDKSKMGEELENKNKILNLRLKTLEKQESTFSEKAQKLREELMNEKKK